MGHLKIALYIAGLACLGACSGGKNEYGYSKVNLLISKDSANSIKAQLRKIPAGLFDTGRYGGRDTPAIPYRLLRPVSIGSGQRYPLVLVLHSSGAIGTDDSSQLGVLVRLWAQPDMRARYPAFVVAPQFPRRSSNYAMEPVRRVLASVPDPCLSLVLDLVDSLKKALPVDEKRIYVIGFSMGGSGVTGSLLLRPDLFAGAVAISGIPSFVKLDSLARIPIWLVHGNADTENPIISDSAFYAAMRELRGGEMRKRHDARIRFWEVEGLDHDIYSALYTGDALPAWLWAKSR